MARPPGLRGARSPTTSAPTTSTGCPCCATRCSCSTTCTCRCSPPPAGSSGWASPSRCWSRSTRRWLLLALFAAADRADLAPGARRSSAAPRSAARRRSRLARHLFTHRDHRRRPARRSGSPGIGPQLVSRAPGRLGALVRPGGQGPLGSARLARASPGRCSAPATSARSCSWPSGSTRPAATCCWCWPPGRGCRPTSAPPSARSASCAASGWTARAGWPGWRTTPPRSTRRRRRRRCRTRLTDGIRFEHVSLRLPGHRPPGPRRRLAAPARRRGGRGRRRERRRQDHAGQAALPSCTSRPPGGSWSTARTWRGCRRRRVAGPAGRRVPGLLPVRAPRPGTASASATCPASTTSPRSPPRSAGPAPTTWSTGCAAGLDTQLGPTWPDGVEVSFGQWQKLALARGFMRDEPAAARARRADRRPGRRDRARPVRALRRAARAATARRPHHDPGVAPVQHGPDGRPDRRARRRHAWSRSAATTSCWPAAASTPSSTASRPPPTANRPWGGGRRRLGRRRSCRPGRRRRGRGL